ncbi:MAG: hypothetical protein AB1941_00045 [Gemmatimonadota bacterium]
MSSRIDNFIIRGADGVRTANSLVLGSGIPLATTAGGLPELEGFLVGETQLMPSGGDDTQTIRDALARFGRVRLAPGEFHVSNTIALGTGQSLVGAGPERTTIRSSFNFHLFTLSGSGTAVEEMSIVGLGGSAIGSVAVQSTAATEIRLRGLDIREMGQGISLAGASRVEISRVAIRSTASTALVVNGPGGQVDLADVVLEEAATTGLMLSSLDCVRCTRVSVLGECVRAALVSQCSAVSLHSIRVTGAERGIQVMDTQGLDVSGAQLSTTSVFTLALSNLSGVHLAGCTLHGGTPLSINGGQAITASGIRTQTIGSGAHVVVQGGATEVSISGIHRVNPATPPTYEVDVSGAGGRVVFIQHNFDPARINSGGNFAAL